MVAHSNLKVCLHLDLTKFHNTQFRQLGNYMYHVLETYLALNVLGGSLNSRFRGAVSYNGISSTARSGHENDICDYCVTTFFRHPVDLKIHCVIMVLLVCRVCTNKMCWDIMEWRLQQARFAAIALYI